ncbi:hypothetical protein JTB14_030016 [Gonioctena quinquepunctata]|nr:hypothetical protein JTB14_030016 [Gonioctena quinquepunctata]
MSVGGIVLITVCLANVLTAQAHYCLCDCNSSKSSILYQPYHSHPSVSNAYLPVTDTHRNLIHNSLQQSYHSQDFRKKVSEVQQHSGLTEVEHSGSGEGQQHYQDIVQKQNDFGGSELSLEYAGLSNINQKLDRNEHVPGVLLHIFKTGQLKQNAKFGSEKVVEGFGGLSGYATGSQYAVKENGSTEEQNREESSIKGNLDSLQKNTNDIGVQDTDSSKEYISKVASHQDNHYINIEQKISSNHDSTEKHDGSDGGEEHHHHHHDHDKNAYYKFEYAVNDQKTHDIKRQKEERKGDVVQGEYSLQEEDGNVRTVKYYADWRTGFHAQVHNSKTKSTVG